MRYSRIFSFCMVVLVVFAWIVLAVEIPIPDSAPPSRRPTEIGSDYDGDSCSDWRLHHQCHFRPGYPGQYGGTFLYVDLFCINVPPCPWDPRNYRDFYALGWALSLIYLLYIVFLSLLITGLPDALLKEGGTKAEKQLLQPQCGLFGK